MSCTSKRNVLTIALVFFSLFNCFSSAQATGAEAYQKAVSLKDKEQRIKALTSFISTYKETPYKTGALIELFITYLDKKEISSALKCADEAVKSDPGNSISIYNEVCYFLAEKKAGLDTAAVYAKRAVDESRQGLSSYLKYTAVSLHIRAKVMFDLGMPDSASAIEQDALSVNKDNPLFLSSLAVYQQASGHKINALKSAAKAILLGNTNEAVLNFNNWAAKEASGKKENENLKLAIADSTLKEFFSKAKKENIYANNSTAAAFLANLGVNRKQSDLWIKEALNSLNDYSSINDVVLINKNYGMVLYASGRAREAFKKFDELKKFADLRDENFWFTLGNYYERQKDFDKAFDSYLTGNVFIQPLKLALSLRESGIRKGLSSNEIDTLVAQRVKECETFNPGNFKNKNKAHTVVLAELFTGTESRPCVGVDYAFEDLSKYFSRNETAILEYHVHIPGPDPMTTPETYKHYKFYGGNFVTPTVFIQGKTKIEGGGPTRIKKNKFDIYRHVIENYLDRSSKVKLSGSVSYNRNALTAKLVLNKAAELPGNTSVYFALVEKSLAYKGNNDVSNHIFVVRSLFNCPDGIPVGSSKGIEEVTKSINIDTLETAISKYLKKPYNDPSWISEPSVIWKKWLGDINRDNLAVVAWLQDNKTKEVFQSVYFDVTVSK